MDGLSNLSVVTGVLEIRLNARLRDLDGLQNITSIDGRLEVRGNKVLSNCGGVAELVGWPGGPPDDSVSGSILFRANYPGCNSLEEVLELGPP